ncbi:hypothetical protein [Mannheimia indoligenes]|uniref:hypothetical protein n=1 Tax=Mannheimia indoligenes TaxID=3103145 RepID=UPI002FE4FFDF
MLTRLNNAFSEWDSFDIWHKLTLGVSVVCFAIPVIGATWVYWVEMLSHIPENASLFLTMIFLSIIAIIYVIALGLLAWIWAYASIAMGLVFSTVTLPFIWLYRKIRP